MASDPQLEDMQARIKEMEDTLEAIRQGKVDALVMGQRETQQVFTLRTADHAYRVLVESMSQGALTVTEQGIILYSNKQFSKIIGTPLEQIIGANFADVLPVAKKVQLEDLLVVRGGEIEASDIECELLGDSGTSFIISAALLPKNENDAYLSIIITDITERKRAEKAKDEFISLASHQLRTPATAVKQYLGMLLEGYVGDLDERQQKFISTAYASNEKQLAIINGILKTAKIDSGLYVLVKTPQNLAALIEIVMKDFLPLLQMRKQELVVDVPLDIDIEVDAGEFSIVLANLIENASKYTPNNKKITIKASQSATQTKVSLTDEGVGIGPRDQDKIFDKFTRIDNAMSDTVTGSGLGLYWTKRIIIMHGGSIAVVSALGKGTTFTVNLPR